MLTSVAAMPGDAVVRAMPGCLDPISVLDAARAGLSRIPASTRDQWKEARLIEALYHPGRYVRVVYAMLRDPQTPTSRAWPEEELVSLFAPVRAPMSRRGEILRIDGCDVEAYCFPNDRRLRGLRTFARRDLVLAAWRQWSSPGEHVDEDSLQRKLVRYVPEQKCVVRVRAEWRQPGGQTTTRRIAVRCGSTAACEELALRHHHVAARVEAKAPCFAVPRLVGCEIGRGLLAVEWLRGDTLIEALRGGDEAEVMDLVVRALRGFHQVRVPNLIEHTNEHLIGSLLDALCDLGVKLPEFDSTIMRLHREMSERLSRTTPGAAVTLHNDLHPDQLTFKRKRVAILDLERMALGSQDIDVSNLATQLEMLGCRPDRDVDSATASRWRSAFLARWREDDGGQMDPSRFHLLAARARLELARGMMRHLRPWWRPFATECLTRAAADVTRAAAGEEVA